MARQQSFLAIVNLLFSLCSSIHCSTLCMRHLLRLRCSYNVDRGWIQQLHAVRHCKQHPDTRLARQVKRRHNHLCTFIINAYLVTSPCQDSIHKSSPHCGMIDTRDLRSTSPFSAALTRSVPHLLFCSSRRVEHFAYWALTKVGCT